MLVTAAAAFAYLLTFAAILAWACCAAPANADQRTVGYVSHSSQLTGEDSAAVRWLSANSKFTVRTLAVDRGFPDLDGIGILWIHIPDSADYARWRAHLGTLGPLKPWYENGGRFLFTGLAAMLPLAIGIETAAPSIEAQEVENDWLFDQKGFQGYRPRISVPGGAHPLFAGLFGGVFTWDGEANHRLWRAGHFGDAWPSAGKVVGVEKAYITIGADRNSPANQARRPLGSPLRTAVLGVRLGTRHRELGVGRHAGRDDVGGVLRSRRQEG